jgi:hypothetical protein
MKLIRILYCLCHGHSKITINNSDGDICCGRCERQLTSDNFVALSLKHLNAGCTYCNGFHMTKHDWALLPD